MRGSHDLVSSRRFSEIRSPAKGKQCDHEAHLRSTTTAPSQTLGHPLRYDFFYKNGVPKWRGTGYYYSRFRPGIWVSLYRCLPWPSSRIFITSLANLSSTERKIYGGTICIDGHDVPCRSHDGVAVYGSETELRKRFRTDREDQTRCEDNSMGKSIGAPGRPKEGRCDLDGMK